MGPNQPDLAQMLPATPKAVPTLVSLINALAEYEPLEHEGTTGGQGIGRPLLVYLGQLAAARGCGRSFCLLPSAFCYMILAR